MMEVESEQKKLNDKHKLEEEGGGAKKKQRKLAKYHHIKAHANPLSDALFYYPTTPADMKWDKYYPQSALENGRKVEFADIGCGYGGLLVSLGEKFPDVLSVGMEIRDKVVQYVEERIQKLRAGNPGQYNNIAVIRTNAMKYLPNYFAKGQLKKIFFLFPDPHFKKSNHRRRIISTQLLAEYAYVLQPGGIAYTITDVEDLHKWMVEHFNSVPIFKRMTDAELESDPVVPLVVGSSEEAKKVERSSGKKFLAVFRRL